MSAPVAPLAAVLSANDKKRIQAQEAMARKRKSELEIESTVGVATFCDPIYYTPYPVPSNSAASTIASYIQNLQLNSCIARPNSWASIINHRSYCTNQKLTPYTDHVWNTLQCNHYTPVATLDQLQTQLDNGLLLPALISPLSELGKDILDQTTWPKESLSNLLSTILIPDSDKIEVQDHRKSKLDTFTTTKTCKAVRARFNKPLQDRGPAWNCLEVKDILPGFKRPRPLELGGSLKRWHFEDLSLNNKNRAEASVQPGTKVVDQWLLVSEARSGSVAHVDVGLGTWISCLAGKKPFWLRNSTHHDHRVWEKFDVGDDHRAFQEPWARVDLTPGSVL